MSEENPHKYFTAGEVAELVKANGVEGFPTTKSGMIKWIKRNWSETCLETGSRKRNGQKGGGGTEYHWAWFPTVLMPILDAEVERRNALVPYQPPQKPPTIRERHRRYRELSKQPPDLTAPSRLFSVELAAMAGLDSNSLTFYPFHLGKVSRCIVEFDREQYSSRDTTGSRAENSPVHRRDRKYFSDSLNAFHGEMVCVTGTDAAPHLLWVFTCDRPRHNRQAPGRLICIADNRAGKAPYVSAELQQAAEAKRTAGHERRKLLR